MTALQHVSSNNANFDPYCAFCVPRVPSAPADLFLAYNDDAQWWGTTAMYAHRAYGDQQFLDWAVTVWDWVQPS